MAQPVFRKGQMDLQRAAVDSATVISRGDMLFLDTDDVKPASDESWDSDLATTQKAFADHFLGIAYEASASGDTDDISVDVSSSAVYEFDCDSATYEIGDDLGPDKDTGNAILANKLEAVTSVSAAAVAKANERASSAVTRLDVRFASAYTTGTANVNAQVAGT